MRVLLCVWNTLRSLNVPGSRQPGSPVIEHSQFCARLHDQSLNPVGLGFFLENSRLPLGPVTGKRFTDLSERTVWDRLPAVGGGRHVVPTFHNSLAVSLDEGDARGRI